MKKALLALIFTAVLAFALSAQAPRAFKYQAVARDRAGQVLSNQNVSLQISILQSGNSGPEIYREHQSVTTSEFGLINLQVGAGRTILGNMSEIDWGSGSHYLRIDMDPSGGTDFELMGISELLSVPYALYADKSGTGERGDDYDWEITEGHVVTGHGGSYPSGYVGIGNNTPGTLLYVAKNMGEPTITIRNLGGGGGATYSMVDDFSGANWKFKATTYGGFKIRDQANGLDVITIEANSAANVLYINGSGNIGIGEVNPSSKLAVNGSITCKEVEVKETGWSDFVFDEGYDLPSLTELDQYIQQHGRLPGVPSAEEVRSNGIKLGQMDAILLQKIEELTLYLIELQKENEALKARISTLKK
ncbi:MAG TPA: hypothetical protein PKI34_06185 [Bacteroidales bacterium]|nr:hypothetical protein [Bacteroidales bacterium]